MSLLDRNPNTGTPFPTLIPALPNVPALGGKHGTWSPPGKQPADRIRIGTAWVGICVAAVVAAALIVFMLQNTVGVEVSFLGLHGTLPLVLALVIVVVGGILARAGVRHGLHHPVTPSDPQAQRSHPRRSHQAIRGERSPRDHDDHTHRTHPQAHRSRTACAPATAATNPVATHLARRRLVAAVERSCHRAAGI